MLQIIAAGNLGKDAEYRETQNGKALCTFALAANIGWGDNKQTMWLDVTKWGDGAKGLSNLLRKGSKVTVLGELSTREHNGKTYLQCRASEVTIQSKVEGGEQRDWNRTPDGSQGSATPPGRNGGGFTDDLDDTIPFLSDGMGW